MIKNRYFTSFGSAGVAVSVVFVWSLSCAPTLAQSAASTIPSADKSADSGVHTLLEHTDQLLMYLGMAALIVALFWLGYYLVREQQRSRDAQTRAHAEITGLQDEINRLETARQEQNTRIRDLTQERDELFWKEERAQGILNAAPFAAWHRGTDRKIDWANQRLKDIVGDDVESLEIATMMDAERPGHLISKAWMDNIPATEERNYIVEGERKVFCIWETPPLPVGGSAGYANDVTGQNHIQRELKRHIEGHAEVLESIGSAIAIFNEDKRLVFYNTAYARIWGLEDAFLNEQPTIGEVMAQLREDRKLPELVEFRQYRSQMEALFQNLLEPQEELYQRPDETMIRTFITSHPFGGLLFLYEDVTDRMVLERARNTLVAVQRATLDNLHEAVAVFGPDGRLKLHNAGYAAMTDLSPEFLATEPHVREIVDHILDETPDLFNSAHRDQMIASTTEGIGRSGKMELSDGRILTFQGTPLPDGKTLFTYIDNTDTYRIESALRERNEALTAADTAKTDFLENVSYELRTPLNTILGFSEILHQEYFGDLNERQKEYSDGIISASNQLLSLINDMLDLASIQADRMQLERMPVSLASIVEDALPEHREKARARQLELDTEILETTLPVVADATRVKQVLNNLISNSIKFTPPGGTITISVEHVDDMLELGVHDSGMGIPSQDLNRVFDRFQASSLHTRSGAGVGLALVRDLVELHGGTVALSSKLGSGTSVICRFPIATTDLIQSVDDLTPERLRPTSLALASSNFRPGTADNDAEDIDIETGAGAETDQSADGAGEA